MSKRFQQDEKKETKENPVLRFGMSVTASGTGLEFLQSYRLGLINQLMITEAEILRYKLHQNKMEEK